MSDDSKPDPDPITALLGATWSWVLADHLGDAGSGLRCAWEAAGLGRLEAIVNERGEPSCDLLRDVTGYNGRSPFKLTDFDVELVWRDSFGQELRARVKVRADSPMDACRVAYGSEIVGRSGEPPYARGTCEGQEFDLEPVVGVLARAAPMVDSD